MSSALPNFGVSHDVLVGQVARRARALVIAVPAVVLVGGAVLSAVELRVGLFATAIVLGWTQLVGI